MKQKEIIRSFSKLSKDEKLQAISRHFKDPKGYLKELKSYHHPDGKKQKLFDEFSENTLTNYFIPYGIAPNFIIDGKIYHIPMVIEESSVVAAASNSAKFWAQNGGFHTEIISTEKIGQVHFIWHGSKDKFISLMPDLKENLLFRTKHITSNMEKRGGGILDIEFVDMSDKMDDYYQLKATFNTVDSMGANFINSCLEEFAQGLKDFLKASPYFTEDEKRVEIIMSILSNYTPNCLVKAWVECDISDLDTIDDELTGEEFALKFEKAVRIAQIDVHRATTHNKGIFNGIDAVALATGNDFRAIEAGGHTFASRDGKYRSLTDIEIKNNRFKYTLTVPLALGTVGGLTSLHPLVKRSLELLDDPGADELMRIAATAGLANNFGALKSLTTKGIQKGHMKMHLLNILNKYDANADEKEKAKKWFADKKVTVNSVFEFLEKLRSQASGHSEVYS